MIAAATGKRASAAGFVSPRATKVSRPNRSRCLANSLCRSAEPCLFGAGKAEACKRARRAVCTPDGFAGRGIGCWAGDRLPSGLSRRLQIIPHFFCCVKSLLDAVPERWTAKVISGEKDAWNVALGFANCFYRVGVAEVILRQGSGVLPHGRRNRWPHDLEDFGVFVLHE